MFTNSSVIRQEVKTAPNSKVNVTIKVYVFAWLHVCSVVVYSECREYIHGPQKWEGGTGWLWSPFSFLMFATKN